MATIEERAKNFAKEMLDKRFSPAIESCYIYGAKEQYKIDQAETDEWVAKASSEAAERAKLEVFNKRLQYKLERQQKIDIEKACEALYAIQDILNADLMDIEKAKDIMRKALEKC